MFETRKAFTLIEIIVVIAIIAILAAILFPVFATAREKARQTACVSNMKQLGLALMQYAEDYDELFPGGNSTSQGSTGWAGQIYSYVKSVGVYRCPDDANVGSGNWTSYAINQNLSVQTVSGGHYAGISLSQYSAPAMTVVLLEIRGNSITDVTSPKETESPTGKGLGSLTGGWDPNGGLSSGSNCPTANQLSYATGSLGGRGYNCFFNGPTGIHNGGSVYVLADGHAKWLMGNVVSSGNMPSSATAAQNFSWPLQAAGTAGPINGKPIAATFSYL